MKAVLGKMAEAFRNPCKNWELGLGFRGAAHELHEDTRMKSFQGLELWFVGVGLGYFGFGVCRIGF